MLFRSSLATLALFSAAHGLVIRDYQPADHDRFVNFPEAPAHNPGFLYADVDLTGVGWYQQDVRRQYTLVSPRHFVGANHFRPAATGSLMFLSKNGVVKTYAIESTTPILNEDGVATDLFIGTLETEVLPADQVNFQPYLSLAQPQYEGQTLIFTGHRPGANPNHRAGRGVITARTQIGDGSTTGAITGDSFNETEVFTWVYQESGLVLTNTPDDAHVQSGDSGSPSLVNVNNRGALVGTHTALTTVGLDGFRQITSIDTFVPFYVDKLNAIMSADGYHMTRAVPGITQPSAPLSVTPSNPGILRAGYPAIINLDVRNTGVADAANNLKLTQTFPAGSAVAASGDGWVTASTLPVLSVRKGGLDPLTTEPLSVQWTPSGPGSFESIITFSADESPSQSQSLNLEVIESFRSWSKNLTLSGLEDDGDGDGFSNLLEYAFGGNPQSNSVFQEGSSIPLSPGVALAGETIQISFLRRTDAAARALTYTVEGSGDLLPESFAPESIMSTSTGSAAAGFEEVIVTVPAGSSSRFFRVAVELAE